MSVATRTRAATRITLVGAAAALVIAGSGATAGAAPTPNSDPWANLTTGTSATGAPSTTASSAAPTSTVVPTGTPTVSNAPRTPGCAKLHVVIAQGTTESSSFTDPKQDTGTLSAAILPVLAQFGGVDEVTDFDRTYVPYPSDFGFQGTTYADSYALGVANTGDVLEKEAARCPGTMFGLIGYSQGAQVASEVLRSIGAGQGPIDPSRVAMGMLYSDPTRSEGSGIFPGRPASQVLPDPAPGTAGTAVEALTPPVVPAEQDNGRGIAPLPDDVPTTFGRLTGRVASPCAAGDLACDTPADAPLARLVTNVAGQMDLDTRDPASILRSAAEVLGTTSLKMSADVINEDITTTDGTTRGLDYTPSQSLSQRAADASNPAHTSTDPLAAIDKVLGIGINTAVAFVKNVVTMENIAQIAAVGLTNPAAGLAVLTAKAADAALQLVPANITDKTATAVQTVIRNEVTDNAGLVRMATDVKYWAARANHESYQRDPITPGGGTWIDMATDWIVAIIRDLSAPATAPSAAAGAFTRTVPVAGQGSYQGMPGLTWTTPNTDPTPASAYDFTTGTAEPTYTTDPAVVADAPPAAAAADPWAFPGAATSRSQTTTTEGTTR